MTTGRTTLPQQVALIDEATCIGCTLCIAACPVDAIVGASRRMHTVIAAECIGCKLCLPPCPVDCITMVDTGKTPGPGERRQRAAHAKRRIEARRARLERERAEAFDAAGKPPDDRKKETIARVMQRARQRLRDRER